MAGYQGGADATVIAAAKSAYKIPKGYHASKYDYKGYIKGIANISKFIVGKVNAASERASGVSGFEEEINKEFWSANNTGYFTDLKERMSASSKTMNMSLPFTKAYKDAERNWSNGMASLNKIKKDEAALEEIIKRVKESSGPNQSSWNNPMLKSLMEEINGDSGMFDNSVRFTDDGIVVIGPDGNETLLEDLPNIASKADGLATTDFINKQGNDAITLKSKGNWNDRNKHLMKQGLLAHLDAQPSNVIGSAAFDYDHLTKNGSMSFADHLMETSGPFNEAFEDWKNSEGAMGASEKDIKETKMNLAQQLWDDNELMKDEYVNWITDNVLGYQIGVTKVEGSGGDSDDSDDDVVDMFAGKSIKKDEFVSVNNKILKNTGNGELQEIDTEAELKKMKESLKDFNLFNPKHLAFGDAIKKYDEGEISWPHLDIMNRFFKGEITDDEVEKQVSELMTGKIEDGKWQFKPMQTFDNETYTNPKDESKYTITSLPKE